MARHAHTAAHVQLVAVLVMSVATVLLGASRIQLYWQDHINFQPDSLGDPLGPEAAEEVAGGQRGIRRTMASIEETCAQPPVINEAKLERWGCTLLRDSCLDQGRILIHSGQKTPGHANYTKDPLFTAKNPLSPGYVLPGYPEPLGKHYKPATWGPDIRAPTPLDPQDVWLPQSFINCSVPLIFWTPYFSIYSIFLLWRVNSFYRMYDEGAFDDSVLFAPHSHGMELPAYYRTHLEPFTRNPVESLSSLSSRERMHEGRSRCYSQMLLCNVQEYERGYKQVARRIVDHYKERNPDKFKPAKGKVFRVGFVQRISGMRMITNLDEVMKNCSRWKLPKKSKFKSVKCYLLDDFAPDNLVDSLAQLERVHALVSTHGSGMANAFFLPNNSAVVEIMCYSFCGYWPDRFYKYGMQSDHSVNSGYFRIRADKDHCFPGEFEKKKKGARIAYHRDKDILVEFDVLAQALTKIALGDVYSTKENYPSRVFNMTRGDTC